MAGQPPLYAILTTMSMGLFLYTLVMLAYVIFSWVPRPPEPLVPIRLGSAALVEPVLRPMRGVIPPLRLGGIALDLSIIIVFIGARIMMSVLNAIARATL